MFSKSTYPIEAFYFLAIHGYPWGTKWGWWVSTGYPKRFWVSNFTPYLASTARISRMSSYAGAQQEDSTHCGEHYCPIECFDRIKNNPIRSAAILLDKPDRHTRRWSKLRSGGGQQWMKLFYLCHTIETRLEFFFPSAQSCSFSA